METSNLHNQEEQEVCCPEFDPEPWDNKVLEWENKRFIKEKVRTFFCAPLNFGNVMTSIDTRIKKAGASITDNLVLSDHTSKWNMDIYLAVDQEISIQSIINYI